MNQRYNQFTAISQNNLPVFKHINIFFIIFLKMGHGYLPLQLRIFEQQISIKSVNICID